MNNSGFEFTPETISKALRGDGCQGPAPLGGGPVGCTVLTDAEALTLEVQFNVATGERLQDWVVCDPVRINAHFSYVLTLHFPAAGDKCRRLCRRSSYVPATSDMASFPSSGSSDGVEREVRIDQSD